MLYGIVGAVTGLLPQKTNAMALANEVIGDLRTLGSTPMLDETRDETSHRPPKRPANEHRKTNGSGPSCERCCGARSEEGRSGKLERRRANQNRSRSKFTSRITKS